MIPDSNIMELSTGRRAEIAGFEKTFPRKIEEGGEFYQEIVELQRVLAQQEDSAEARRAIKRLSAKKMSRWFIGVLWSLMQDAKKGLDVKQAMLAANLIGVLYAEDRPMRVGEGGGLIALYAQAARQVCRTEKGLRFFMWGQEPDHA